MSDIYTAPEAELTETTTEGEYGSIEKALSGDYEFDIGSVLSEAWGRVSGNKLGYFLCSLVVTVILIGTVAASEFLSLAIVGVLGGGWLSFVASLGINNVILPLITTPLTIGFSFVGVYAALGRPYSPSLLFAFYSKVVAIFLVYILVAILTSIGFLLLIIPGIYLAVAYSFSLMLIADKDMHIWEALETSRKAVTKRWFAIFGLLIVLVVAFLLSLLTLGIALIWIVPFIGIAYGITYRNIFGVESNTLARS